MEPRSDTTTATINADAAAVWRVLADEFLENDAWTPGVISSAANPATPEGINGSRYGGRVSEIEGLGKADVRLVDYDDETRKLSYTLAAENVPPFIERLQNTWTVTPVKPGRCEVSSELQISIASAMSDSDKATMAAEKMFGQIAASVAALAAYVESDDEAVAITEN